MNKQQKWLAGIIIVVLAYVTVFSDIGAKFGLVLIPQNDIRIIRSQGYDFVMYTDGVLDDSKIKAFPDRIEIYSGYVRNSDAGALFVMPFTWEALIGSS